MLKVSKRASSFVLALLLAGLPVANAAGPNYGNTQFNPTTNPVTAYGGSAPLAGAASATVSNVTISGVAGSALGGGQSAAITLLGDTVKIGVIGLDAPGWFTGLPAGLTVTVSALAGSDRIILTFGGTPQAASDQPFSMIIPGSFLDGANPIPVAYNADARFNIASAPTPPQPPSNLPRTGDGFPLRQLLALMGITLAGLGWLGRRGRGRRA